MRNWLDWVGWGELGGSWGSSFRSKIDAHTGKLCRHHLKIVGLDVPSQE